ncbi:putative hydrolase [Sphingomonas changbaiensis NBRC 104936]|uniref:Putative hydrolase n=1 Tax=Sphingomonas changbaiensis NBRC 104936 TaxID=1219043 RepID=A0A0E9ML44_9SPHN|nr:alpha/beta hydrolase [Sphingomonas changbaiensis]GAO38136.1 putative hydrolase [Sphingomonas changbaiensis NBRC 104936]
MFRALFAAAALIATPAFAAFQSDRISVTTEGTGPDVVLIHGLASSPRVWKGTIERVPGYRYHLVQIAGMGATPPGGNAQGAVIAPVAEEVARYISEENLGKPALIGHSMGGTIAMMVAARHPDEVGKLMIVDMYPFVGQMFGGPNATSDSVRPIADAMRARSAKATPEERDRERRTSITSMINTESERAGPIEDGLASNPDTVANAFAELIVTDLRPELKAINVPTTVLYVTPAGAPFTDEQMDANYKAAYADIPGVTVKRVPNSAHFIMLDAPGAFADEVKAFLAQ